MNTSRIVLAAAVAVAFGGRAIAGVTVDLSPTEDTFVYAGRPGNTYGTAGAMNISGPGTSGGPFASAMKFDSVPAAATFNLVYGVGNWVISSAVLQVTEDGNPPSLLFPRGAGVFQMSWISNDNWTQGTGSPQLPGTATGNQLSYTYLQTLLGSSTQASLGTFSSMGTDGRRSYSLAIAPSFFADVAAGDPLTLIGTAISNAIGFTFNSNDYFNFVDRPVLSITATEVPEPASALLMTIAALGFVARRRRDPGRGNAG